MPTSTGAKAPTVTTDENDPMDAYFTKINRNDGVNALMDIAARKDETWSWDGTI